MTKRVGMNRFFFLRCSEWHAVQSDLVRKGVYALSARSRCNLRIVWNAPLPSLTLNLVNNVSKLSQNFLFSALLFSVIFLVSQNFYTQYIGLEVMQHFKKGDLKLFYLLDNWYKNTSLSDILIWRVNQATSPVQSEESARTTHCAH